MNQKKPFLYLLLAFALTACGSVRPRGEFDANQLPPVPDYARLENWAAHPDKSDPADRTPIPEIKNLQDGAPIDVLFFYPTTYTGSKRSESHWNADVNDAKTNKATDEGTILFQASIFNGVGRVFSPRYRQAHLSVFYDKKRPDSDKAALALAYSDIEAAFDYYLKNWNNDRPFIIAAHSQGALHAMNLIQRRIENTPLQSQLVAAYIVGWPVRSNFFKSFKPCQKPDETNCYCSWRTWNRGFVLERRSDPRFESNIVCTNPLNWTTTEGAYSPKSDNKGGVVRPFGKVYPQITDAEVYRGILLSSKPKFRGSVLFRRKNYHIGDLNLYYMNVRENAGVRTGAYFRK